MNQEAIEFFEALKQDEYAFTARDKEMFDVAIQALKEPTRDLISRQAVINITAETGAFETQARVRKLPSYSEMPNKSAEMTWVTGADGAKVAFKDVPIDKVVKICEILGEDGGE